MLFEDEQVMFIRDEIVGVIISDDLPVFPILDSKRVTHGAVAGFIPRVVSRLAFGFSEGEHTISLSRFRE